MADKMREEFEAWAVRRKGPQPWELPHFVCFKNEDGTYVDNGANVAWEAWQASRESLVIELPMRSCDAAVSDMNYHKGWNDCLDWSRKNIEEDGLKVKP